MITVNHNRVLLPTLAIGGYLQRCATRQFACNTDYFEKVVKFLCFGDKISRFAFNFNILQFGFFPQRRPVLPLSGC